MNIFSRFLVSANQHLSNFQRSPAPVKENTLIKTAAVAVGAGLITAFVSSKVSPSVGVGVGAVSGAATFAYLTKDEPDLSVEKMVDNVKNDNKMLKEENKTLQAQIQQLKGEKVELEANKVDLEVNIVKTQNELKEATYEVGLVTAQVTFLQAENETLEGEVLKTGQELKHTKQQLVGALLKKPPAFSILANPVSSSPLKQLKTPQKIGESESAELKELKIDNLRAADKIERLKAQIATLKNTVAHADKDLEISSQLDQKVNDKAAQIKEKCKGLKLKLKSLIAEKESLAAREAELSKKNTERDAIVEEAKQAVFKLKEEKTNQERTIQELENQIDNIQQKGLAALEVFLNQFTKIKTLEAKNQELTYKYYQVKRDFQSLHKMQPHLFSPIFSKNEYDLNQIAFAVETVLD